MLTLSTSVFSQVLTEEVKEKIDAIRIKTQTPGVAVAVVTREQTTWQHFSGLANMELNQTINEDSQFRFGSISKILVSVSILKLVEENRVNLNDKLSDLAPEIGFSNPWESTHPVRLVHLLNHSSGWDGPHFVEKISHTGSPISTIDAIDIHPHSRISRWPPGSRTAYNNTSFLVAAYIVEKLTNMPFEEYVKESFFKKLGMENTGYFFSDSYRNNAVTLYSNQRERPYYHINNRASGALNSSIKDMTKFLSLLVQNKPANILSPVMLTNLQTPAGTAAANLGMEFTWGLGTQIFHANGIPLYGHEGSLRGANSILIFNRELEFGYLIVANTNSSAVPQIHQLLSNYLTLSAPKKDIQALRKLNKSDKALSGWYRHVAPVRDLFSIIHSINPWRLKVEDRQTTIKPMFGRERVLLPNATNGFIQDSTGMTVLVPSDNFLLSSILYYGPQTLIKTNGLLAWSPITIITFWSLMAVSGLMFSLVWLPRYLLKKSVSKASIVFRAWPLFTLFIAGLSLLCIQIMINSPSFYDLAGKVTFWSFSIFIGSIAFAFSSAWSMWILISKRTKRLRSELNVFTYYHTILFSLSHFLLSILLMSHGLIGLRLWL
jgi:CubicO group peptidase (beta-lactamase class C family)